MAGLESVESSVPLHLLTLLANGIDRKREKMVNEEEERKKQQGCRQKKENRYVSARTKTSRNP